MAGSARSVCFLCLIFTISKFYGVNSVKSPPVYNINLDLEPEKRWLEVVRDYGALVQDINKIFLTYIPKAVLPLIEKLAASLDSYFPSDYAREIKGIAQACKTELGEIVLANLVYDLTAHCTSIVAEDKHGMIWHVRNMDYAFTGILENITIFVNFQKDNKTLYSGTSFAGTVGLLTGLRHHSFSVSVDERDNHSPIWYNALIGLLDKNASVMSFAVRNALEKETSFSGALKYLEDTDTMAPVYYIMGGTRYPDGAVITRGRTKPSVDTWRLDPKLKSWYLVETNYDHWLPTPQSDKRREAAVKMMNALGQSQVNAASLFKVLHTEPLFRPVTVYTSVMSANSSVYQNWIWSPW